VYFTLYDIIRQKNSSEYEKDIFKVYEQIYA